MKQYGELATDLRCKDEITYEPVEKGVRRKLKDGKKFSYEATADFGNEDKGDRWDITRFWNEAIFSDIAECWRFACEVRQIEDEMMTELEKAIKQAQKQQRLEKAKAEHLKGNPTEDILIEYK